MITSILPGIVINVRSIILHMKQVFTGANCNLSIGGIPVDYADNVTYVFHDEFNSWWLNNMVVKCDNATMRIPGDHVRPNASYGRIYNLYEFLWKLKILKL